jgi:hypothetical protein
MPVVGGQAKGDWSSYELQEAGRALVWTEVAEYECVEPPAVSRRGLLCVRLEDDPAIELRMSTDMSEVRLKRRLARRLDIPREDPYGVEI